MIKIIIFFMVHCFISVFFVGFVEARDYRVHIENSQRIRLQPETKPKLEQNEYEIMVYVHDRVVKEADNRGRVFPIMYLVSAGWYFSTITSMIEKLQYDGVISTDVIVVGITIPWVNIGNPAENINLLQTRIATDRTFFVLSLGKASAQNGAMEFLNFIENELIPKIEFNDEMTDRPILADVNNRTFFIDSGFASLGYYTLLNRPNLFKNYIFGSPVARIGTILVQDTFRDWEKSYTENLRNNPNDLPRKNVVVGVGLDDDDKRVMRTAEWFQSFAKNKGNNIDLTLYKFPGERHATAMIPTLMNGLRDIYGDK